MHPAQPDFATMILQGILPELEKNWIFFAGIGILLLLMVFVNSMTGKPRRNRRTNGGYRRGGRGDGRPARAGAIRSKPMLSEWEAKALPILASQCPRGTHLCPQAHIGDFLRETGSTAWFDWSKRFKAVGNLIVDFLVIDANGRPLLVIELDDKTHLLPDRMTRDQRLNQALAEAGVKVLHVRPNTPINLAQHLR